VRSIRLKEVKKHSYNYTSKWKTGIPIQICLFLESNADRGRVIFLL
jgi:hypothetical protein